VLRFIFHREYFSQFAQQFALALAQLSGCLDSHLDIKIAFAATIEYGHAFAPDPKRRSRLRAFGNFQPVLALQRGNHDLRAQSSLGERDRHHAVQVVALALKESMFFDVQYNIQIARRPAERARFAESAETNARAVLHSRRHLGFHHTFAQQAAFAFALRAWLGDYAARALAGWAGASNAEEPLLIPHLPSAIARPAGDRSLTGRCAVSAARVAGLMAAHADLLLGAKDGLVEFEMQVFAQIGSALGAAATASPLAEQVAETEHVSKNVAEILEDGGIESRRTSSIAAHAGVSEAVVQRSLLAVGENGVRLRDFLELLFRIRIVRVAVGMVRHRELAVSALDLNVGGRTGNTEYFVIIAFRIGGQKLPPTLIKQIG